MAYVPVVPTERGTGGVERSRRRRIAILQLFLFLCLREVFSDSHAGAPFRDGQGRDLLDFTRVLTCLCDKPEERAGLRLKPGQGLHPYSSCTAPVASLGAPRSLTAKERSLINTLNPQWEAASHLEHGSERQRRLHLERALSVNSYPPALAAMAGLTTTPFSLYKKIGFDALHIRLAPGFLLMFAGTRDALGRLRLPNTGF